MSVYEKLLGIQSELKAPKGQFNSFGKYYYRSCEDIVEAVKPLNAKYKTALTISDDVVLIGDRYYIKATAKLTDTEDGTFETVAAYAREEEVKKGMDGSQITGSSSSYARKYALNGLFAIDDTKDSDSSNTGGKSETPTDWRTEFIKKCTEKGIDSVTYAQEHGITKQTTQEQFRAICESL